MKRFFCASMGILLFVPAVFVDAGLSVGFDQNGDGVLEPHEQGIQNAVAGQEYSMDVVLDSVEDLPDAIIGTYVMVATPDTSKVSGVEFSFNVGAMPDWMLGLYVVPDSAGSWLTPQFIEYRSSAGKAWRVSAWEIVPVECDTVDLTLIGTLKFTALANGCISWGIDPGYEGLGTVFVDCQYEYPPFMVPLPIDCSVTTATEEASWGEVKEMFR